MAKGGNKNFRLVKHPRSVDGRGRYHVHLLNGQHVAEVSEFRVGGGWRFKLDNYSHSHSKLFGTLKACLAGLEDEVL